MKAFCFFLSNDQRVIKTHNTGLVCRILSVWMDVILSCTHSDSESLHFVQITLNVSESSPHTVGQHERCRISGTLLLITSFNQKRKQLQISAELREWLWLHGAILFPVIFLNVPGPAQHEVSFIHNRWKSWNKQTRTVTLKSF